MPRITEMYAWVIACDDEDDEKVPTAIITQDGRPIRTPIMGADRDRVDSARRIVQEIASERNRPVKLLRFAGMEVIDEVHP